MTKYKVELMRDEVIKQLNLIAPDLPIDLEYKDLSLLTTLRMNQNKTIKQIYSNIVDGIRSKYGKMQSCNYSMTIPSSKIIYNDWPLSFVVNWPTGLDTNIEHVPRQNFVDFIVYICSTIGIWFGVSALSIIKTAYDFHSRKHEMNGHGEGIIQSISRIEKRMFRNEMKCEAQFRFILRKIPFRQIVPRMTINSLSEP